MALVLNGDGTVTGLAVGGLPDGTVDAGTLATDSVTAAKLEASAITSADLPAGSVLQVVSTNFSDTQPVAASTLTTTVSYESTALTPMVSITLTPISATSYFYVSLTGRFGVTTGYRCQILLTKNYTAGTNVYAAGNYILYDHYGIYNNTGGDCWMPGAYTYMDKSQTQTVGVSRTYYWFGGTIGGGTQQLTGYNMTVTEIEL